MDWPFQYCRVDIIVLRRMIRVCFWNEIVSVKPRSHRANPNKHAVTDVHIKSNVKSRYHFHLLATNARESKIGPKSNRHTYMHTYRTSEG